MKFGRKLRRVDVQVSMLTIATTVFCTICVYLVCYHLTYYDMIRSLEDRAYAIHDYLDDMLDKESFYSVNVKEDKERDIYKKNKLMLESVKLSTNVMYLYTAKKNEDGNYVYCVDGLSEEEDFRYPGDPIEPEIYESMERALHGEVVLPEGIKATNWGKIFITYFPIHDGEKVVGVLGIEFDAGHQYRTYQNLKIAIPMVILLSSLLASSTAILIFRRISNPSYRDMSNTDQLTGLKNRNAFQTDLNNLNVGRKKERVGLMETDLNNLKLVNDRLGHGAGDLYIKAVGTAINRVLPKRGSGYRLGGDEFAVLLPETNEIELKELAELIRQELVNQSKELSEQVSNVSLSLAIGYSLYQSESGEDLMTVFDRADEMMYKEKKRFHDAGKALGR